jgi:hypothetical protein
LFSLAGLILMARRLRLKRQARRDLQLVAANHEIFYQKWKERKKMCPDSPACPWTRALVCSALNVSGGWCGPFQVWRCRFAWRRGFSAVSPTWPR